MAYQKTNWVDRLDTGNKYRISDNPDGTKKIEYAGVVNREGTPMSADNFNKMENGIETAQNTADNAVSAASAAQTTADNALLAANTAQSTADNAASAASAAQSTADNAVTAAGTAQNKADSAVQNITIGGTAQTKTNGTVNLPAYPTSLPANGGNASTVNGHTVNKDVPSDAKFTDNNTTYSFENGSANGTFKVTPSGGTAQAVSIGGLKSAAYTESSAYATSSQGTKADTAAAAINNSNSAAYIGKFKRTDGTIEVVNFANRNEIKTYAANNFKLTSVNPVKSVYIEGFNISDDTNMDNLFNYCNAVESFVLKGWDTSKVTKANGVFYNCHSAKRIVIQDFAPSKVSTIDNMFIACNSLEELDISGWKISDFTMAHWAFAQMTSLKSLKLSNFDISNAQAMYNMFDACSSLETLDLTGWNFLPTANLGWFFSNCPSIKTVYVSTPEAKALVDARLRDTAWISTRATLKYDNAALTQLILSLPVYGAEWNGTSTTAWTRTDAAASFGACNPYVAGATFYSSPFDNIMPWAGMQIEERTGGTMVRIPKFYYKLEQKGDGMKILISNFPKDGFYTSPAHMNRGDGKGERDYVYIGRYHCCNSTYKSTSGVKPQVSVTRANFRTNIHNLGTNIWQADFAMRFTIWLLYIVEFADWNSQVKIGRGCSQTSASSSAVFNMGYTDTMPYHTGTTQSARTSYGGTQYRNIEGLWDNCYDWTDGCYNGSNGFNIILNPANFSDSSGGTKVGKPLSGYPSKFLVKDVSGTYPMFIPTEVSGSESTYSCGYWYFDASYPCVNVGGCYNQSMGRSLFFVDYNLASYTNSGLGSRLMELP